MKIEKGTASTAYAAMIHQRPVTAQRMIPDASSKNMGTDARIMFLRILFNLFLLFAVTVNISGHLPYRYGPNIAYYVASRAIYYAGGFLFFAKKYPLPTIFERGYSTPGAFNRDRTGDLILTMDALYLLSYEGIFNAKEV